MKKSKTTNILIDLALIAIILISGFFIFINIYPRFKEKDQYEDLSSQVTNQNLIDWESLKAINPDVVGWIKVPETHIDYPVTQTSDNDYYLLRNFNKEESGYGNPFLDFTYDNNNPMSKNAVIYGHNSRWGDQVGFEGLSNYDSIDYFNQKPIIYYATLNDPELVPYEVVAVLKVDQGFDYRQTTFTDNNEFLNYYNNILSNRLYDTGKVIYGNDQLITLSSCNYDFDDARIVVVARRTK